MKLLNLNCWEFAFFDKIVDFVHKENPEIIAFQEASTSPIVKESIIGEYKDVPDFLEALSKEINYKYIFAPSWGVISKEGINKYKGVVIFYKPNIELIDFHFKNFSNYLEYPILTNEWEDGLLIAKTKKEKYIHSWKKPLNYLYCLFKKNDKYFKVITTQLCISYFCTETLQRLQQGKELAELISNSLDIPTIICGDFNITADSETIKEISDKGMKIETIDLKNSLEEKVHPMFDPSRVMTGSSSSGYCVDHILTKNIKNSVLKTFQGKAISDHIAMTLEFEV